MNVLAIRAEFEHAAASEPRIVICLSAAGKRAVLRALDSEHDYVLRGKIMRAEPCVTLSVGELGALIDALEGDTETAWLRCKLGSYRAGLIARAETEIPAFADYEGAANV